MGDSSFPKDALSLLGRAYRERASGSLLFGPQGEMLRVALRDGQIAAIRPGAAAARGPTSGPDDSAGLRLERVLVEVGLRRAVAAAAPDTVSAPAKLRDCLLAALAERKAAEFVLGLDEADALLPILAATEPMILEAVRRLPRGQELRRALGDLDRCLVATTALAEERTLTLTEGYLLSRIDGRSTAREVLQLIPLDPDETERTLLSLLLTGRVEYGPARPLPAGRPHPSPAPSASPASCPPGGASARASSAPGGVAAGPEADRPAESVPLPAASPPTAALTLDERREILELFESLPAKNHFEVLGVEPGASSAEVKRAYSALVRRFHPDVKRQAQLGDLRDILEAIFIRIGEAWEVLGEARSRAAYEARFGLVHNRPIAPAGPPPDPSHKTAPSPPPPAERLVVEPQPESYSAPEETLGQAQMLLAQARYWDAIQVLEANLPHMRPQRHQHRGRVLLARAYAKNPNWVRRAEEALQRVMREDPLNADAHYELGLLYKAGGLAVRAQALFRRTIELRPDHREAAAELGLDDRARQRGLLQRLFRWGRRS